MDARRGGCGRARHPWSRRGSRGRPLWSPSVKSRSRVRHDRDSLWIQGILRRLSVGGRCLASPMSTTIGGAVRGRGPRRRRLCSSGSATTSRPSATAFQAQAGRPLGGPAPRHRRHRRGDPWRCRLLLADESLGGDGHAGGGGVHPRTVRGGPRISPSAGAQLVGDALDLRHRHPLLWSASNASRCRPGWPGGSPNRPTVSRYAGARWVDDQLAARAGWGPVIVDRIVAEAIAQFDPEEHERREDDATGRLGRHAHPPRPDRLRRHLPPGARGDSLTLQGVLRPGLRPRPPAVPRRRHRPARGPEGQGPRHHHRSASGEPRRAGQTEGSRSTSGWTPTTSTSTHGGSAFAAGRSRSSAPPP